MIGAYIAVASSEIQYLDITLTPLIDSDYVNSIYILVTDGGRLPSQYSAIEKISMVSIDYGSGYDLSIENGGYNQIEARNHCLEQIYGNASIEWIMQVDADEYVTKEYILDIAKNMHQDVVIPQYITPLRNNKIWFDSKIKRRYESTGIIDPHIVCWRCSLGKYYIECQNSAKHLSNTSRHCSIDLEETSKIAISKCHVYHLHCLFGKRNTKTRQDGIDVPEEYLETYTKLLENANELFR